MLRGHVLCHIRQGGGGLRPLHVHAAGHSCLSFPTNPQRSPLCSSRGDNVAHGGGHTECCYSFVLVPPHAAAHHHGPHAPVLLTPPPRMSAWTVRCLPRRAGRKEAMKAKAEKVRSGEVQPSF